MRESTVAEHDPLCGNGEYDGVTPCLECDQIAKVRADERQRFGVVAVVETLRYCSNVVPTFNLDKQWLRNWADEVQREASRIRGQGGWTFCPFCSEVQCDDDCPLLPLREGIDYTPEPEPE